MGRNLDDIIGSLPAERQAKVERLSQQKVEEMIAHAATLTDFRKAVGKTQAQVAKELGIKQNAVSQLEKRSDTYVSTLRRFLKTLDLTLELSVVAKNGTRIDLPNFLPWREAEVAFHDSAAFSATEKAPARKGVSEAAHPKRAAVAQRNAAGAVKKNVAPAHKSPSGLREA